MDRPAFIRGAVVIGLGVVLVITLIVLLLALV
jgi:hypothetical protein